MSQSFRKSIYGTLVAISVSIGIADGALAEPKWWSQHQGDAAHSGYLPRHINPLRITPLWTKTKTSLVQTSLYEGVATDSSFVYLSGTNSNFGTNSVLALDRSTGLWVWEQRLFPTIPGQSWGLSAPSAENGMVYAHRYGHSGSPSGGSGNSPRMLGMQAQNGAMVFSTAHAGQWSSGCRPTVEGEMIFGEAGYYGGMEGYNATTGATAWFSNFVSSDSDIPSANSTHVFSYNKKRDINTGVDYGTLFAIDRTTGQTAYTIRDPQDHSSAWARVVLGTQNDALVVVPFHGSVTSFDLESRSIKWRTTGIQYKSMAVGGGTIFVKAGTGVTMLNESTGENLGNWINPGGHTLQGDIIATGNLVFAGTNYHTYAFDRSTRETVWSTTTVGNLAIDDGLLVISNSTSVSVFSIPEPSTVSLLLIAGLSLARVGRRRS